MKIAVVFFNLGGPDSKESIEPFLMNFFTDKNIIRAPYLVRWLVAKLVSQRRAKKEAGESYGALGNKSPLIENSEAQVKAVEKLLNKNTSEDVSYKGFICMRYWHPMAEEVAKDVQAYAPDEIILLPLYPQFSTTTTRSSIQAWEKAISDIHLNVPTKTVCCYPFEDGFLNASAGLVAKVYKKAFKKEKKAPRILFSAHGLPEKIVKDGDPYQWQCEESARLIAEKLKSDHKLENLDWQICYQSRVGPLKWIGPSTEEALEKASEDNVPVVIYPHAFTQEHVETLVEIDIEYREMAEEMGLHAFYKVDTVGSEALFIEGLATVVEKARSREARLAPDTGARLCDQKWRRCPCKEEALPKAA